MKPWTVKRLNAAINALTAMLAGEEGEGDWDPDHSADDMNAALTRLQVCSCGARRYVGKESRIGTVWVAGDTSQWSHPESTFCG